MASAAAAKKWPRLFQFCAPLHVHQPDIRFVDQGRGLKRLPGPFVRHLLDRQLAQFVVHLGQQFLRSDGRRPVQSAQEYG